MRIVIPYSSKWSASFCDDEGKQNIILSGKSIKFDNKKQVQKNNDNYEELMINVSNKYPNFKYKTISKSTVVGILSRLAGETRYISDIVDHPNHPILSISDRIRFECLDRVLFNEVVNLHKPPTDVQNQGGGFIKDENANFLLLSKNKISILFFSLFKLILIQDIIDFVNFVITNPSYDELLEYLVKKQELYEQEINPTFFLNNDATHRKTISDLYRKDYTEYLFHKLMLKDDIPEGMETIILLDDMFHKICSYTTMNIDEDGYFIYTLDKDKKKYNPPEITGFLYYLLAVYLERNGFSEEIQSNLFNKKRYIPGIAKNSGGITIKGFLGRFSPKKVSYTMPYMLDAKFTENKKEYRLGLGKEDGILIVNIDIPEKEARSLKERIECCGVSTFALGKKGLAYVKEISVYE